MTLPMCMRCGATIVAHDRYGSICTACDLRIDRQSVTVEFDHFDPPPAHSEDAVVLAHDEPSAATTEFGYRDAPPPAPVTFRKPIADEDFEFHMEAYRSNVRLRRAERVREFLSSVWSLLLAALMIVALLFIMWAIFSGH